MRFGIFPKSIIESLDKKRNIWFHAVSVGEFMAILGLMEKMRARFSGHQIVLSTVTQTGFQLAKSQLKDEDIVIYAPLDLSFIVNRFIDFIDPVIYINAETEIWPNLFLALSHRKVPLVEVNGRISNRSFQRYQWIRFLLSSVLEKVELFCMQSQLDRERIISLGANSSKVILVGHIKFDEPIESEFQPNERDFGPKTNKEEWIWVAGSTHPGEEEIVLKIYQSLKEEFPRLRLIIAPRHIERTLEIENLIQERGYRLLKLSVLLESREFFGNDDRILLVDTIGHLRSLYRLAKIVFVGKSLIGVGGQNIIEPAKFGKAIIVGPHMENFKSIVDLFLRSEAIIQVQNEDQLKEEIKELLSQPARLETLGHLAKEVVQNNQGATEKTFKLICDLL